MRKRVRPSNRVGTVESDRNRRYRRSGRRYDHIRDSRGIATVAAGTKMTELIPTDGRSLTDNALHSMHGGVPVSRVTENEEEERVLETLSHSYIRDNQVSTFNKTEALMLEHLQQYADSG